MTSDQGQGVTEMKLPLPSMGVSVLALVLSVMRTADAAVGGRLGSVFSTPPAGKRIHRVKSHPMDMAIEMAFALIEIQLQRQYGLFSKFSDDSWEGRESPKYEAPVNMKSGLNIAQQYLGDKSTRAFFVAFLKRNCRRNLVRRSEYRNSPLL